MSEQTPSPGALTTSASPRANAPLIERVKDILLRPKATWTVIDGEPATVQSLLVPYALLLAAIGPLAGLIGGQLFGYGVLGVSYKPSLMAGLSTAAVSYVMTLVGVVLLAVIINALAQTFGGTKNTVQAFKVAVYSATASWLAGVFGIVPALAILGILGLYSLYLLYLGLPVLMKAPQDKALPYTAVVVVAAIVMALIVGAVSTAVTSSVGAAAGGFGAVASGRAASAGRVTLPGGVVIDSNEMEKAARDMEAAVKATENGDVQVVPAARLQALLPASVAGLARTSQESSQGGVGGMTGSRASAEYSNDTGRITLSITDMGAMGGLAGMAGAMNLESSSESNGAYERVGKVDGRFTTESYDRNDRSGEYGVLVANRIMIEAEGQGVSIEALKAAVGAVGFGRVEALARR